MRTEYFRCSLALLLFLFSSFQGAGQPAASPKPPERLPNLVIILADDLGYGDVSCYGASRIRTPNIDRLADQGLRFTDAHSNSATCTPRPTRYSPGNIRGAKKEPAFCQAMPVSS